MFLSKHEQYLVINRLQALEGEQAKMESIETDLENLSKHICPNTVFISKINTYEIYTRCPETGVGGWDIKNVRSTDELINSYPHFDVVITKNDCQPIDGDWLDYEQSLT